MTVIDTIDATPTARVLILHDTDCPNPLENWSHGVQFVTLPSAGRTWSDYVEPHSDGAALDIEPGSFREFWDGGWYGPEPPEHQQPTLRRYLDTHTAAWCTLDRNGYNGALSYSFRGDDIEDSDAIAYVSREEYRKWHMIPDGKPMPRGYRQRAADALQSVITEYNRWAEGECYGIQGQRLIPACTCCGRDPHWEDDDDSDSGWGIIGSDYAREESERMVASYQLDDGTITRARRAGVTWTTTGPDITPRGEIDPHDIGTIDAPRYVSPLTGWHPYTHLVTFQGTRPRHILVTIEQPEEEE